MFPFKEDAWKTGMGREVWSPGGRAVADRIFRIDDDDDDAADDDDDRYGSSWIMTVSQVVSCTLYQSDQWNIPSYGRFFPIKITMWFRDLLSGKHPKNWWENHHAING